jgi:hypothetical protein
MHRDRVDILGQSTVANNTMGITGSNVAATFLKDLKTGKDSLDVMVIGDSNAGSGNYGYTTALYRALGGLAGVNPYACPLFFGAGHLAGTTVSASLEGGVACSTFISWYGDGAASGSVPATAGTFRKLVTAALAGNSDASALIGASGLNINTTNYNTDDAITMLPRSFTYSWAGAFVEAARNYTSDTGTNYLRLTTTNPLNFGSGTGGVDLQYRVVYGKFTTAGGQFRLQAYNQTDGTYITAGSYRSTQKAASEIWDVEKLDFTSPSGTLKLIRCVWDGHARTGYHTTGPFACLWQSVIRRNFKGYAVNNFMYHGGATTLMLADRVEGCDKLLDSYLEELRKRQQEAGGSGRVLVWVNSGLNTAASPDTGTSWTTNMNRIVTRIAQRWVATGGLLSNLAFVTSVSHPTQTTGPANAQNLVWAANRAAVASAASDWGLVNAGNGYNVTVVDIANQVPLAKLVNGVPSNATNLTLLDSGAGGDAHLNATTTALNNGYDVVTNTIISSLLSN